MDKPLPVVIDDTKQALIKVMNESGLPACVLAPLAKELFEATMQAQQAELEHARAAYSEDKEA